MSEPDDECREIHLPSGPIRLRSERAPTGEDLAALEEIVSAAKRLAAARPVDDGAAELWARIDAVGQRGESTRRDVAEQVGVRFSTMVRIAQGRMPDAADLAAIETWLTDAERSSLSQWCTTPSFPCEEIEPDSGQHSPVNVPGHTLCAGKRWYETWDPEHNAGPDEAESWACGCECHSSGGSDA